MIRTATSTDLERIVEIYNQAVTAGFQTADTDELSVADRIDWFQSHNNKQYPLIVEDIDGVVRGWLSISPYRPGRKALQDCVEISFYVDHAWKGQGIGAALVAEGLKICAGLNYYSVFAIVIDRNLSSIRLLEKFNFTRWAHLPDIADFNGVRCGQLYYGLHLK